jgi:regulator of sirC expression with transglutaminase-like and TPR domain
MTALRTEFHALLSHEPIDLTRAVLAMARVEYPSLDAEPTLAVLDDLGRRAAERLTPLDRAPVRARIAALNHLLFDEARFSGNRTCYADFRNSLLNDVVARRLGIPISLAVVYMHVARRAGLEVLGVSFPGHFLMTVPGDAGDDGRAPVVLDPFDGGAELDERACRRLFVRHAGADAAFAPSLLRPCTGRALVTRMLSNLKRAYVDARSFPQALAVTELLLAAVPSDTPQLRDRGLLAYHLDDDVAALRDLEDYIRLRLWTDHDREERDQIRDHIRTLRRRVATLN